MVRTNNVMIDLETFGVESGNIIRSISAVRFDSEGNILKEIHCNINEEISIEAGFTKDPETVLWWESKSEEAKEIFKLKGVSPKLALIMLSELVELSRVDGQVEIWGNSPTLDCVMLRKYYQVFNIECPFFFYEENDYRTIKKRAVENGFIDFEKFEGIAHFGLDDAKYQVKHLIKMLNFLGIK